MTTPTIYLLDLNYTLVENSDERRKHLANYSGWIEHERYRGWLVHLLKHAQESQGCTVIMLTARPAKYQGATIENIEAKTGWKPDKWMFMEHPTEPHKLKREMMLEQVIPVHGKPERTPYVALESNRQTRSMYEGLGIRAERVPERSDLWRKLPGPLMQIPF